MGIMRSDSISPRSGSDYSDDDITDIRLLLTISSSFHSLTPPKLVFDRPLFDTTSR